MSLKLIVQTNEAGIVGLDEVQRKKVKELITFQIYDWVHIRNARLFTIKQKIDELDKAMKHKTISYNDYVFKSKRAYRDRMYWDEWDGSKCFLQKSDRFPIGFLSRIKKGLWLIDENFEYIDTRRKPLPIPKKLEFRGKLRNYQNVILNDNKQATMGIFDIATGAGKTVLAIALICYLNVKTVVVVPTVALLNQWIRQIRDFSNANVGFVSGNQLADGDIYVINQATLNTAFKGTGKTPSTVERQQKIRSIWSETGCIIIDECHKASAKTWVDVINRTTAFYRYGFSATIGKRSDKGDFAYHALLGDKLEHLDYNELVEMGGAVPINLYFHEVPYIYYNLKQYAWGTKTEKKTGEKLKLSVEESYIRDNKDRNAIIVDIALDEGIRRNKRTLLLFRRVLHGEKLYSLIKSALLSDPRYQMFNDVTKIQLVGGDTDKKLREQYYQEFRDGKITLLIAQTQLVGMGWDVPNIEVLVAGFGGKSEIDRIQNMGRGSRISAGKTILVVHDFADQGEYVQEHAKQRMETYLENGAKFMNPKDSFLSHYVKLR